MGKAEDLSIEKMVISMIKENEHHKMTLVYEYIISYFPEERDFLLRLCPWRMLCRKSILQPAE